MILGGLEGLEAVKAASEVVLEGGEVGIELGPGERDRGGEERGVRLKIIEGYFQVLFFGVYQFQGSFYCFQCHDLWVI